MWNIREKRERYFEWSWGRLSRFGNLMGSKSWGIRQKPILVLLRGFLLARKLLLNIFRCLGIAAIHGAAKELTPSTTELNWINYVSCMRISSKGAMQVKKTLAPPAEKSDSGKSPGQLYCSLEKVRDDWIFSLESSVKWWESDPGPILMVLWISLDWFYLQKKHFWLCNMNVHWVTQSFQNSLGSVP